MGNEQSTRTCGGPSQEELKLYYDLEADRDNKLKKLTAEQHERQRLMGELDDALGRLKESEDLCRAQKDQVTGMLMKLDARDETISQLRGEKTEMNEQLTRAMDDALFERSEKQKMHADWEEKYRSLEDRAADDLLEQQAISAEHVAEIAQLKAALAEKEDEIKELHTREHELHARLADTVSNLGVNQKKVDKLMTKIHESEKDAQKATEERRKKLAGKVLGKLRNLKNLRGEADAARKAAVQQREAISAARGERDERREKERQEMNERLQRERDENQVLIKELRSENQRMHAAAKEFDGAFRGAKVQLGFQDLFSVKIKLIGAAGVAPPAGSPTRYTSLQVDVNRKKVYRTKAFSSAPGSEPQWNETFAFVADKCPEGVRFSIWDEANEQTAVAESHFSLRQLFEADNTTGVYEQALPFAGSVPGSVTVRIAFKRVPQTQLKWLSGYNHDAIATLLRRIQADVESKAKGGRTLLMTAAKDNNVDMARTLCLAGADLELGDSAGVTALMCTAIYGRPDVAKVLLEFKASPDAKNNKGLTALMVAAVRNEPQVARVLMDHGASLELCDVNGMTALLIACVRGNVDVADMLVRNNANLEARASQGRTPLMFTAYLGNTAICRKLLKAGADVDATDNDGHTALQIALDAGRDDVAETIQHYTEKRSQRAQQQAGEYAEDEGEPGGA